MGGAPRCPSPDDHRSSGGSGRVLAAWLFYPLALSYHLATAPRVKDRRRDGQRKANGDHEGGVLFTELKRIRESLEIRRGEGNARVSTVADDS